MIPTLGIDEPETFVADYYEREQPVVLRRFGTIAGASEEIARALEARIARGDPGEADVLLWHDVRPDLVARHCATPPLIGRVLEGDPASLREKHVRVWFSVKGHRTPWHYDGNSLHVFNLQLKGRKRWRIVSPDTPLMCLPFMNIGLFARCSMAGRRSYEFELDEGDLLFLPRYWFHSVDSLGDLNINVNWVLTSRRDPIRSLGGRREAELLWIKRRLYPILPPSVRDALDQYGGQGRKAVDELTKQVSAWSGTARGLKETLKLPLLLAHLPGLVNTYLAMKRSRRLLRSRLDAGGSRA